MCNACGFYCCASDCFGECGCDHCPDPACWTVCPNCGEQGCAGECSDDGGWHHPDDDVSTKPDFPSTSPKHAHGDDMRERKP